MVFDFYIRTGSDTMKTKVWSFAESSSYNPAGRLEWLWPELFPVNFHVQRMPETATFKLSLLVSPTSQSLVPYRETLFETEMNRICTDLNGATEGKIACIHSDGEFRYLHLLPSEARVSSAISVIKYMEDVTTTVTRQQLQNLVERIVQAKTRSRNGSSGNSPYGSNSPPSKSPGLSPGDAEVVYESPLGGSSVSRKRSLGESEDQTGAKRQKTGSVSII